MKNIHTEILIKADIGTVWRVLMDLENYKSWNPFIIEARGDTGEGGRLEIHLQAKPGSVMTFRPVVLKNTGREFRWLGKLLFGGLFDGEHYFILEDKDGKVAFQQGENFRGLLVPFLAGMLRQTEENFKKMNVALKERCEQA